MAAFKNKFKIPIGYNVLAELVKAAVERWTAESPKTYKVITYVSLGLAITSSAVLMIPTQYPVWVIPTALLVSSIASKFTVKDK